MSNVRRFLCILMVVIVVVGMFAGCGSVEDTDKGSYRFQVVEEIAFKQDSAGVAMILVDTQTGVLYLKSGGNDAVMTVLLDANGNPLLFEGSLWVENIP